MSMMYEIRHYQDWSSRYLVIATCGTIDEARELRCVSGDLVVENATDVVVDDLRWLWDWERIAMNSYARQNLGCHRPGKRIAS